MLNGWLRQRGKWVSGGLGADPAGQAVHAGLVLLGKVIRVADPRVLLGEQPPVPAQGACGYIIGEKLRSGSPHVKAALSRQGRYQEAAGNLQVKEVRIAGAADRFVICYHPDAAVRDVAVREDLIAKPGETIAGSDKLSAAKGAELRGKISMLPGLNRFLRVIPGGLLGVAKAKAKAKAEALGRLDWSVCANHL
jgi:hypothetical protein